MYKPCAHDTHAQIIGASHVILKIFKVYPYTTCMYSIGVYAPYIFLELHWERLLPKCTLAGATTELGPSF